MGQGKDTCFASLNGLKVGFVGLALSGLLLYVFYKKSGGQSAVPRLN